MSVTARRVSPELIVLAGCLVALITFGPRASAGLFQIPMTLEYGWGRDVFGLAIALQNLLWGLGQPFAGAVADRFGTLRVLCVGAVLYAAGLVVMAYATSPGMLHIGAGVLIGFGLSGCSFNLVLGAFSKLLPEQWRPMAFGAGTAAGSFGQFLFPPIGNILIDSMGWQQALVVFAATLLLVLPLSLALATRPGANAPTRSGPAPAANQSIRQALAEAFRHRSYVLLVLGFFTCGFQLAFITAHLPAYLKDAGLSGLHRRLDARRHRARQRLRLALVRLALDPHVEALAPRLDLSRALGGDRRLHSAAGLARHLPLLFGVAIGLLWLSTVPPTSSLVMLMFGTEVHGDALRLRVLLPSGRRLPRRLARRRPLRGVGQLRHRLVALGGPGAGLRGHQPADRGAPGRASGRGSGGVARRAAPGTPRESGSRLPWTVARATTLCDTGGPT